MPGLLLVPRLRRHPATLLLAAFLASATTLAAPTVRPRVVAEYPHDAQAFTEGLVFDAGKLYESTGLTGQSTLRRVDLKTGQIEKNQALASELFGEGLARVDERLIQLTWKDKLAIVYDRTSFAELQRFAYTGEGWGICFDGSELVMSDGSDKLFFRNAETFELTHQIAVADEGVAVQRLNELECVGSEIFANQWMTDRIVRVDKTSGAVLTNIDAAGLLSAADASKADVLNGIAFMPESRHFLLTGKLWPKVFEVELDFDAGSGGSAGASGVGGGGGQAGSGEAGNGGAAASGTAGDAGSGGTSNTGQPAGSHENAACGCRAAPREPTTLLGVCVGLTLSAALRRRRARR